MFAIKADTKVFEEGLRKARNQLRQLAQQAIAMSKEKPTDREKKIEKLREELGITRAAAAEMLDQEAATKPEIPVGGIGGAGTAAHKARRMKTVQERLADTVAQGGDVPPLRTEG